MSEAAAAERPRRRWPVPLGIFLASFLIYLSNGDFLPIGDAMPNAFGAARMLRPGSPTFTPEDTPYLFLWTAKTATGEVSLRVLRWDQKLGPQITAKEWKDAGRLAPREPEYYLWPTKTPGVYAGIYGPWPALSALPVFLAAALVVDDLPGHPPAVFYVGKVAAAALAAGSVVFVFLAAALLAGRSSALAVAAAYALGTPLWSEASQCLWQQSTHLFFLSMGSYFLIGLFQGRPFAAAAGAAFGAAVCTRPTGALALAAVAALLAVRRRDVLLKFGLGAAAVVAATAVYQFCLFGVPWPRGQMESARRMAEQATGNADVWQTPFWLGAAGMLLSPSRGLLILSPVLAFAGWGAWRSWKDPAWLVLRPLSAALGAMLLVSFKWYLWWGGPCFGPRMLLDTLPLFALLLVPVAATILGDRRLRVAAAALLAWSVLVQVVGAFAFEPSLWNARVTGYEVAGASYPDLPSAEAAARRAPGLPLREIREDVADSAHRSRLWSLADNQVAYFLTHFSEARGRRRAKLEAMLRTY